MKERPKIYAFKNCCCIFGYTHNKFCNTNALQNSSNIKEKPHKYHRWPVGKGCNVTFPIYFYWV